MKELLYQAFLVIVCSAVGAFIVEGMYFFVDVLRINYFGMN